MGRTNLTSALSSLGAPGAEGVSEGTADEESRGRPARPALGGEPPVFKTDAEQDPRPGLFHHVALNGEGRLWVEAFRSTELMGLTRLSEQAVTLLRRRRIDEAHELFAEIARRLASGPEAPPAGREVFDRFYYGARAYYFYCLGDYMAADEDLERAHAAVAASVGKFLPLLPLAQHASELRLQRARIARNRNLWSQMGDHVAAVRAMIEDRSPLCTMADSTPVFFSTLSEYYGTLPHLREQDWESLSGMLDSARRRESFEITIRWLYALPGMAILYP